MNEIKVGMIYHKLDGYTPIYIGRNGAKNKDVKRYNLGNPFTAQEFGLVECITMYEDYLRQNMELLDPLKEELKKNNILLKCFCKGVIDNQKLCHGDVIRKLLKETI